MKSDRDGLLHGIGPTLTQRSEVRIIDPKNGKGEVITKAISLALEIARFIIELLRLLA